MDKPADKDELARMRARIERLRGLCKTAVGFLRDADAVEQANEIAALIGDMEAPVPDSGANEPFCWYRVTRDITDEYVTVFSEDGERPKGEGWKPLYEAPRSGCGTNNAAGQVLPGRAGNADADTASAGPAPAAPNALTGETPRTERALCYPWELDKGCEVVRAGFARQLERELASKTRDADHFFQLSGRYLEELNAARSASGALTDGEAMAKVNALCERTDPRLLVSVLKGELWAAWTGADSKARSTSGTLQVPYGMKCVPTKPTPRMLERAYEVAAFPRDPEVCAAVWSAMVEVAPTLPYAVSATQERSK